MGKSRVEAGATSEQKLHAFAQAELVSRDGIAGKDIVAQAFDPERTMRFAREAVRQETEMLLKWKGKTFSIEGVVYPAVTVIGDQRLLHPELLRQVRKNGAETKMASKELAREIHEYIRTLNAGFDFIVPAHDLEKDLLKAAKMSEDFGRGIIQREALLDNFKGVMTKETFFHATDKKQGMKMFVDIKDMGIQNLQSFQHLSRKVASGKSGPGDLLTAGKEITDSFMHLVRKIKEEHPSAQVSL